MRALVQIAGAALVAAYAVVVASVRSFTWPALVLTAIAGIAVLMLAAVGARRAESAHPGVERPRRGIRPWAVLVGATLGWQLLAYLQSPRHDHPTISSMIDSLEAHRPLRGVLFVAWVVLGRELARR